MIQSIRGTKDILPDTISRWHNLEEIIRKTTTKYGYEEARTPIFEKTEVFSRSIGEETDIVNKEMYTFQDRGGDSITLRPEMTAAIARSVIQNSLLSNASVLRYWYVGPFFRYERPQQGRLRQFHQFGAECIGTPNPEADVEVIMLADHIIRSAGISEYKLLLNTLGTKETREKYRSELVSYFKSLEGILSEDSRRRLLTNPLRILDSKDEKDSIAIQNAPMIGNFLDAESSEHYDYVKNMLDHAGLKYELNPLLVRGLDYYDHTVFEFQSTFLGAQDSFGGGGRYNGLFQQLGGKATPAVGLAMGMERILMILEKFGVEDNNQPKADIFIVVSDQAHYSYSMTVSRMLRDRGLSVVTDLMRRSMKAQFREANRLSSRYTIVIGDEEADKKAVQIKNMASGEQVEIQIKKLSEYDFA